MDKTSKPEMSEGSSMSLSLSDVLPLPYRVLALFQSSIVLWYLLVYICYYGFQMNILSLLNLSYSPHKYSISSHDNQPVTGEMATIAAADKNENILLLQGIRRTMAKTLTFTIAGIVSYWIVKASVPEESVVFRFSLGVLPLCLVAVCTYVVFRKGDSMGQNRLNTSIKRILRGGINSATMRTNDILLSDTLTSYAKVMNDLGCSLWTICFTSNSSYNIKLEALVLSYPALVRAKQCWYEYKITKQRQHVLNLFKYLCSLGPVLINLLIKINMEKLPDSNGLSSLNTLNKWWYFLSAVSSAYSFVWDIKMDWGFEAFDFLMGFGKSNFMMLRDDSKLVYKNHIGYYSIILLDFILRFIWVLKIFVIKETEVDLGLTNQVGNFLFGYDFLSFGFMLLEILEIYRRWLWCFIKLEGDLLKLQLRDDFARATPMTNIKIV